MKKYALLLISILIIVNIWIFKQNHNVTNNKNNDDIVMVDLIGYTVDELNEFVNSNHLKLKMNEIYSDEYLKNTVASQSIKEGSKYNVDDELIVDIVIGNLEDKKSADIKKYIENNVNELGRIPIMMYHGIHDKKNSDTIYTGGNVDKDGYQRTVEAFRNDLEFYYNNNYRMIRLDDYVDGIIDVELGKSPIVLTFDDGLQNNINVTGLDDDGNIIIDPNCAVGILEEFKQKYPDYNVTATFFVNSSLFNQPEYNEEILKWLIENGYDVGNHSATHPDFTKISSEQTNYQIGSVYEILESIIPNLYVNIVALPFGSPYKKSHENFLSIISSTYNGKNYETKSALRVGWESDYSPFSSDFDKSFIKRIRAYDNNGIEFDIQANFETLEKHRYVSDGNKDRIVIKENDSDKLKNDIILDIVTY